MSTRALWRPGAVLLLVSSIAILLWALWFDEITLAVASLPMVGGTLLVLRDRTAGLLLLLTGATPTLVCVALMPGGALSSVAAFAWWVAPSFGALLLWAPLVRHLLRRDWAATAIAVAMSVVLGFGLFVFYGTIVDEWQTAYWTRQGEREAAGDWHEGFVRAHGDWPSAAQVRILRCHGTDVVSDCGCIVGLKEGARRAGYDREAQRLFVKWYGSELGLGCRLGRPGLARPAADSEETPDWVRPAKIRPSPSPLTGTPAAGCGIHVRY